MRKSERQFTAESRAKVKAFFESRHVTRGEVGALGCRSLGNFARIPLPAVPGVLCLPQCSVSAHERGLRQWSSDGSGPVCQLRPFILLNALAPPIFVVLAIATNRCWPSRSGVILGLFSSEPFVPIIV